MSYSIVYDKQFIKVENEFIPFILSGDSNLYEYSGRRVRGWHIFSHMIDGKLYGTLEEMVNKSKSIRENIIKRNEERNKDYLARGEEKWISEYSDKKFGWFDSIAIGSNHTSNTSYSMFENIFKSGCKKSVTIEEAIEFGARFKFKTSDYEKEKLDKYLKEEISCPINTTEEFIEKYKEFTEYLKETGVSLIFEMNASEEIGKRIRKSKFSPQKRQKEFTTIESYFIVKDLENYTYVVKATRNGYRYGKSIHSAKVFIKKKEAEKYAQKLNEKFGSEQRFIDEKVNEPKTLLV
jgi:hypothetical protein